LDLLADSLTPECLRVQPRVLRDKVLDIYQYAKFSHDPSMGFFSPFWGSSNAPQPNRRTIFHTQQSNDVVSRKGVPFGVRKQNLTVKPPNIRARLDGTKKVFGLECFTKGILHVNSP